MEKKKNTPKLRFPEFTGEWEEKKLGEIAEIITGNTPPTANNEYYNGDCLFVSPYDINGNRFVEQTRTTLTKLGFSKGRKIRAGSSLFVCIGSTIGKVAQNKVECVANQQINSVIPYENYSDDFVYTLLERNSSSIKILAAEQAVPIINKTTFSNYTALVPFLAEQTKIATFLTAVDEKLTKLKKKKTLLEQYKKGVMQKLFSQELRFKDDNNQDFPDWQEKTLGEVSQVKDGTHESPQYYECGFPFITSKNLMTDGNIDLENVSYINEDDFRRFNIRSKVEVNDILFAMIGTIGNPVLVRNDGFAIKNIALIKEKHNLLNIFLIHYMKGPSIKQQFFEQNTGGTQKFLSLGIIKKLIIDIPSLPEQVKIATFLSVIDEKISHSSAQIEKMEAWKKGLLQQMFC